MASYGKLTVTYTGGRLRVSKPVEMVRELVWVLSAIKGAYVYALPAERHWAVAAATVQHVGYVDEFLGAEAVACGILVLEVGTASVYNLADELHHEELELIRIQAQLGSL